MTAAHLIDEHELVDPDIVINVVIGAYNYRPFTLGTKGNRGLRSGPILESIARDFILSDEYKRLRNTGREGYPYDVGVLILNANINEPVELVTPALLGVRYSNQLSPIRAPDMFIKLLLEG